MKNSDIPAIPVVDSCGRPAMYSTDSVEAIGFTKREMMAMHMMAAMLSSGTNDRVEMAKIAKSSVAYSDILLAELEKQQ